MTDKSADPRRCEADNVVRGRFTSPLPPSTGAPFAQTTQKSKAVEKITHNHASFYQSFTPKIVKHNLFPPRGVSARPGMALVADGRTASVLVFLWYEAGANVFFIPPYPASTRAPFAHMTQVSKAVGKIMRSLASFYQSFTK